MGDDYGWFRQTLVAMLFGMLLMAGFPAVAAQVGDALTLGQVNKIDHRTDLKGKANGANLQIKNTGNARALTTKADKIPLLAKATSGPVAISAKASRNAIKIKVDPDQAPLKVNASAGTATNLSADLLDGMDSTAFLQPSGVVAVHVGGDDTELVFTGDEVVRSVSVTAPADGVVIVTSTANVFATSPDELVRCSITTGTTHDIDFAQRWEGSGAAGSLDQLAGTRGFDVAAGQDFTANLVCDVSSVSNGSAEIRDSALTAIFIPNP